MNIVITGFPYVEDFPIVYQLLNELDVKKCYILCGHEDPPVPKKTTAIYYHDASVIMGGNYVDDWTSLIALDNQLLTKLSECEVNALKMIERGNIYGAYDSYQKRKRSYLKHVRYWNHILETEDIKIVISSNIPHQVYDYVIYSLCKIKNIPYIILFQSQVDDTVIYVDDLENPCIELKLKYEHLQNESRDLPVEKIDLSEKSIRHFKRQIDKTKDPHPFYMVNLVKKKTIIERLVELVKNLLEKRRFLSLRPGHLIKLLYIRKYENLLFGYYEKHAVEPDLTQPFIYLALHFQPELTTSPLAKAFVEQYIYVQLLAANLPKGYYIYVKEHPMQRYLGRDVYLYKEIARIPNVRLVPRGYNSFRLIEKCMAVATCTGTVGWEALFREKPVFLFGSMFFQYVKGVFCIQTADDCKKAIDAIFNQGIKPDLRDVKLFLKALEDVGINAYIDPAYKVVSTLSVERKNQNLIDSLVKRVSRILKINPKGAT